MIWCLLGDTGDGKNIFGSWFAYQNYLAHSSIYANYHLNFPFNLIEYTEDLNEIPIDDDSPKLILIDELHLTGDAYDSQSRKTRKFARFIVQARKKDADVIHFNQHESMIVKRVRVNTSLYLKPRITLCLNEDDMTFTTDKPDIKRFPNRIPYIINIRWYNKFMVYEGHDIPYVIYPAHLLYDTRETLDELHTVDYDRIEKRYKDFNGSVDELIEMFVRKEGLGRTDAKSFGRYLEALKKNPKMK